MQVSGKLIITGQVGHKTQRTAHQYSWQNCQTVETIGKVYRITGTDNNEVGKEDIKRPEIKGDIFKERHNQFEFGGGCGVGKQKYCRGKATERLPKILPARGKTARIFMHYLAVVVDPAN